MSFHQKGRERGNLGGSNPGGGQGPDIVIDGYNLAHLMGWLPIFDQTTLSQAREKLLAHLAGICAQRDRILVVFDARGARKAGVPLHLLHAPSTRHKTGIQLLFATDREADEEIEDLLDSNRRRAGGARRLIVVSNDRRLQIAAKRAKSLALTCDRFLDRMEEILGSRPEQAPDQEKPETTAEEEKLQALEDFKELEQDPKWKRALDPYGFKD